MKLIFKYAKRYLWFVFLVVILVLAQSFTDLYLPALNADIINNGVVVGNLPYIWKMGALMLLIVAVIGLTSLGSTYFSTKASMFLGRDMRRDIFYKVQSFSQQDIEKFGTPSLITRTTNDITQIQNMFNMLMRMMLSAPIMCIGGIFMAMKQDVALSGILIVVVPVAAAIIIFVMKKSHPMFQKMQTQVDKLNQVLREQLSGIRVIRAFVRNSSEQAHYDKENLEMRQISVRSQLLMNSLMPIVTLIVSFSTLAAYWLGALRVEAGMPVGNLTAFVTYLSQILMSINMSSMLLVMLPRVGVSAKRIEDVLNHEPSIVDSDNPAEQLKEPFNCIEFRNIYFTYPEAEKPVLSDICFKTYAGETTAIIGSTGSGKSTLINLIPRFYEVTSGSILINGVDIRSMSQDGLRKHLGFIPQKALLFDGTVESNLRYGKTDATEDELWEALETAQGKDFIKANPLGLQMPISQSGSNVSGGQRQRLAIARAIVKNPDVYIFDDSFSALDFKTDAKLRSALSEKTKGAAVIIVAQRVSTILGADRIVVLDEGAVAGIGTHKELMQSCQVYKEIVFSQLSKEEVA